MSKAIHIIRDAQGTLLDIGISPMDTINAMQEMGKVPKELDLDAFEKILRRQEVGITLHMKTDIYVRRVK